MGTIRDKRERESRRAGARSQASGLDPGFSIVGEGVRGFSSRVGGGARQSTGVE